MPSGRSAGGGGKVKVDLQWQGFLSEAAVKAIGFLHIVIYGTKLDGNLKVSLKGTSNAGEMMEQAGIKELIDEIKQAVADVNSAKPDNKPEVVGALSGGDKEQNEARPTFFVRKHLPPTRFCHLSCRVVGRCPAEHCDPPGEAGELGHQAGGVGTVGGAC